MDANKNITQKINIIDSNNDVWLAECRSSIYRYCGM